MPWPATSGKRSTTNCCGPTRMWAKDGRAERIAHLERWLEEHPGHGGLLLALGLLYLDDRQYDKARSCLEEAVRKQPGSEGYAALGRVLDHAGKLEAAAQCYRNALRLRSGRGAEPLPPPTGG
jgi:HemY protein